MEVDDATPDLHTWNGEYSLTPYVYEIPANVKLTWKRISFDVTFYKFSQKFFLKGGSAHWSSIRKWCSWFQIACVLLTDPAVYPHLLLCLESLVTHIENEALVREGDAGLSPTWF